MSCPRRSAGARLTAALLIAASLVTARPARAQQPDAGSLLNRQRQLGTELPERLPEPSAPPAERPTLPEAGLTITVKAFRFTGHGTLATEAELQDLVADAVGKPLGWAELQALATRVTAYLQETKGYLLAWAYLPEQDVSEGVLEIAVVGGVLDGRPRVHLKGGARASQRYLERVASEAVPEGKPLRLDDLERAVLLLGDLPAVSARASLEPGEAPGSTRVVIDAEEGDWLSGSLRGDDEGDRHTGKWREGASLSLNDAFGWGDRLSVSYTHAEGSDETSASYVLALGATGLVWNLGYTHLYYELGDDLSDTDSKGWANTYKTGLDYPLLRTRAASLWGGAAFDYEKLNDWSNGARTRERQLYVGTGTLAFRGYDRAGRGRSRAPRSSSRGAGSTRPPRPTRRPTSGAAPTRRHGSRG